MLNPLVAFLIGYMLVVVLSARRVKVYASLLAMIIVFAVLTLTPAKMWESLVQMGEWNNVRVFIYIFLSMLLAGILREQGRLQGLVDSTGSLGCRFSLLSVPAIIGLMPMPGGALVSAIALKDKFFREARLSPEDASYINYWWRHVWVPVWPLFQSVVITAAVLNVNPLDIVRHTWPGTIGALLGGGLIAYFLLRGLACPESRRPGALRLFAWSFWPLLLLAILFLLARTPLGKSIPVFSSHPMLVGLALVVAVTYASKPLKWEGLRKALALATKPTIHAVLFESLLLKNMVILSDAGHATSALISSGVVPLTVLVFLIPLILGLAAGGENFFASTAIPLLIGVLMPHGSIDWLMLVIAYIGGYLGVMMSPIHLCLVLTVDYYNARMTPVLLRVAATVVVAASVGLALAWIIL